MRLSLERLWTNLETRGLLGEIEVPVMLWIDAQGVGHGPESGRRCPPSGGAPIVEMDLVEARGRMCSYCWGEGDGAVDATGGDYDLVWAWVENAERELEWDRVYPEGPAQLGAAQRSEVVLNIHRIGLRLQFHSRTASSWERVLRDDLSAAPVRWMRWVGGREGVLELARDEVEQRMNLAKGLMDETLVLASLVEWGGPTQTTSALLEAGCVDRDKRVIRVPLWALNYLMMAKVGVSEIALAPREEDLSLVLGLYEPSGSGGLSRLSGAIVVAGGCRARGRAPEQVRQG